VWFGNAGSAVPEFGLVHLGAIVPELEALHREQPIELTVVSNSRPMYEQYVGRATFPTRYVRWRPQSFHRDVSRADVCVLPVVANPFTIGKTSNRLVVALELGVPVVAGDIPSYREFDEWIGIEDWQANIAAYAADPELAARHVAGGRAQIRECYSDERITRQWQDAITSVCEPGA
jgi:glycosyltransferase involved in cell wall biosynthesis